MKKTLTFFSLLCFLPIFNAFNLSDTNPECEDIKVNLVVEDVVWNATPSSLFDMLGDNTEDTDNTNTDDTDNTNTDDTDDTDDTDNTEINGTETGNNGTGNNETNTYFHDIDEYLIGLSQWDIPTLFHIVKIGIDIPVGFLEYKNVCTSDILINQYGRGTKPIIVIFTQNPDKNTEVTLNTQNTLTGFRIFNPFIPNVNAIISGGGPGVATTIGVLARTSQYETQVDEHCIEIIMANKVTNIEEDFNCIYDNTYRECKVINSTQSPPVNIYPNPVSNDLFVQRNGMDISKIELLTVQGKIVNDKISIRKGIDNIQISTSNLTRGIYFLKIKTPYSNVIEKIIIQNK